MERAEEWRRWTAADSSERRAEEVGRGGVERVGGRGEGEGEGGVGEEEGGEGGEGEGEGEEGEGRGGGGAER